MSFSHRVRTIYRKELIDILRDRRTLIAMILVPIVLYPLLLLGSVQAVSHQSESLGQETLVIGVINERQASTIRQLIAADAAALAASIEAVAKDWDRAKTLARAGRELVEREFDIRRTVDRLEALFAATGAAMPKRAIAATR